MASTSVSELAVASVKALTRPAQPDTEDIDQAHDRIASAMAASQQKEIVVEHYKSIASDHAIALTLQEEVTPVRSPMTKKPKTCRVLGLDIKCKACKERRKANRCVRRQEWFASQQTEHVPKRPRRAAMAAAAAIAENLQDGEVEDGDVG